MPPIVIKHGRTLTVVFSLLHYTFGDAGEVDREGGDLLQRRGRGDNIIESLSSALSTRSLLLHTFSAKQDKTQIFPRSRSRDYRSSLSCRSLFLRVGDPLRRVNIYIPAVTHVSPSLLTCMRRARRTNLSRVG